MQRRWIAHLLIMLIALQSVIAMADVHQTHQSNIPSDSINTDLASGDFHDNDAVHTHEQSIQNHKNNPSEQKNAQIDCQHCCHCHASSPIFLTGPSPSLYPSKPMRGLSKYSVAYLSYLGSPDFRPPIA